MEDQSDRCRGRAMPPENHYKSLAESTPSLKKFLGKNSDMMRQRWIDGKTVAERFNQGIFVSAKA